MSRTTDHLLSAAASDPTLAQLCDEIIERLQAGDGVDLAALALEHPEHADQLRRLVPALEALVDLGASSAQHAPQGVSKGIAPAYAPRVLGDYHILREIGRGGMGVVYEAEQRSLNRRVALKVLPMAAALDPRQFQRFQLEARAAACLHHNNIVPVFAVGTEGGVPFYAMQYIEGRSVADVIHELRRAEGWEADPPAPDGGAGTRLADLSTTALARSLVSGQASAPQADAPGLDSPTGAYRPNATPTRSPGEARNESGPGAKPANLSATKSGSSTRTREYCRNIASLGLQAAEALDHAHAHGILHRDIKPGNLLLDREGRLWVADFGLAQIQGSPGLTFSGNILGTLRYMSPEQALGKGVVIDGRTDVYSLGVTLYELLTLRPALDGKDRAEILRKPADNEPQPLRKLNPSVPHDLGTIVHKAMAREPSDRYATAKELAEDLQRFLLDRPILAKPPSLIDRSAKWAKRHKPVVASMGVLLVLTVAGLTTGLVMIAHEQRKTSAAMAQVKARRDIARQAVDDMYTEVAQHWLKNQAHATPLQRKFLEKALRIYRQFADEPGGTPEDRRRAAEASIRAAQILGSMGHPQDAQVLYERALALSEKLSREFPNKQEYRYTLANAHNSLAVLRCEIGLFHRAEQNYREALEIMAALAARRARDPVAKVDLANACSNLGALLTELGRPAEAERLQQQAIELRLRLTAQYPEYPDYEWYVAKSHINLAELRKTQGRIDEAEKELRAAESILLRLGSLNQGVAELRDDLAGVRLDYGNLLKSTGRLDEGEKQLNDAIALEADLVKNFPDLPEYRKRLADAEHALALLLSDLGRDAEADAHFKGAGLVRSNLLNESPDVPAYRKDLAQTYHDRARFLTKIGKSKEAESFLREGVGLWTKVIPDSSEPGQRKQLAEAVHHLGALLREQGHVAEGEELQRRAQIIGDHLAEPSHDDAKGRGTLANP